MSGSERNIALVLEYDGTGYGGWQVQPNAPSIQAEVESALETLLKSRVRVTASGRTDAGVHALGQVVHFRTRGRIPLKGLFHGLNSLLPPAVAVRRVHEMPPEFDARRSAREKTYRYRIHRAAAPSAFARPFSWRLTGPLDLTAMAEAGRRLVGTHDFAAFRAAGCGAVTTVRTVTAVDLIRRGEFLEIEVTGNGFLRHMVRIMVGTLVEVGRGRMTVGDVADLLSRPDREGAGPTAPARGLVLVAVRYSTSPLGSFP